MQDYLRQSCFKTDESVQSGITLLWLLGIYLPQEATLEKGQSGIQYKGTQHSSHYNMQQLFKTTKLLPFMTATCIFGVQGVYS